MPKRSKADTRDQAGLTNLETARFMAVLALAADCLQQVYVFSRTAAVPAKEVVPEDTGVSNSVVAVQKAYMELVESRGGPMRQALVKDLARKHTQQLRNAHKKINPFEILVVILPLLNELRKRQLFGMTRDDLYTSVVIFQLHRNYIEFGGGLTEHIREVPKNRFERAIRKFLL